MFLLIEYCHHSVSWSVCLSVSPLVITVNCGKTAESLEMLFDVVVRLVDPKNHVLDRGIDPINR